MTIFDFKDYREFVRFWVQSQPQARGVLSQLAKGMEISTTMLSQILGETKKMSPEMADRLALFIGLTEKESDFLFLMVEFDRAGTVSLRRRIEKRMQSEAERARQLESRVKKDHELSESAKSIYYSSWIYSAVRNISAIPEFSSLPQIAAQLQVSEATLTRVIQFLVEHDLIKRDGGRLEPKARLTHLPAKSPLVVKHHQNWRLRGFQKMDEFREDDFFFSGPMSMSSELAAQIRTELPTFLEKLGKRLGPSKSEVVRCLNIDWFEF